MLLIQNELRESFKILQRFSMNSGSDSILGQCPDTFFSFNGYKNAVISIGFGKEMSHLIICVLCTVSVFIIHTKLSVC